MKLPRQVTSAEPTVQQATRQMEDSVSFLCFIIFFPVEFIYTPFTPRSENLYVR